MQNEYIILSLVVLSLFSFVFSVFLALLRFKKNLEFEYTLLEVKPPSNASESQFSTEQLFTFIHNIKGNSTFLDRLLGIRQLYSLELVSTKKEGIKYIIRIPKESAPIVKKSLLGYLSSIGIKETNDYLSKNEEPELLQEFVLAKDFRNPLENQSKLKEYDPIAYITSHMTKLKEDELISVQVVVSPRDSLRSGPGLLQNIIYYTFSFLLFLLLTPFTFALYIFAKHWNDPLPSFIFKPNKPFRFSDLPPEKKEKYLAVGNKISQELFETSIRVLVKAPKEDAQNRASGIFASFGAFNTQYQSFKVKQSLFDRFELIRRLKRFLFQSRLLSLGSNSILSVSELSTIYHFPYTPTTKTEDLVNIKTPALPAPLSLKNANESLDVVFAKNTYGEETTSIGLTLEERRRHAYIIGATGTGKSTLLTHMIYEDISKGKGLAVIDPHGDLAEQLIGIIPKDRFNDVVYFNPYDIESPIGLNLLELSKEGSTAELDREKDLITSSLISVFHKLYSERYSGPRMEHILRNTILTALETENPTLSTIYELLTNNKYRREVVKNLKSEKEDLRKFWNNEFNTLGSFQKADQISPITNKLGRFLTTTITKNILNQEVSGLNFEDIMNNKKILICNLSKGKIGEDISSFLGSLIIAKLQLAALKRIHISQNKRIDFFLYIDEFQNFATEFFAQILSEARKYRLNTILAHQNTAQLEDNTLLETILGNTGTVIAFRTQTPNDENKLLPIFSPEVEKGQVLNIPSYNFYMKILALEPRNTFTGNVEEFNVKSSESIEQEVIIQSRLNYGLKVDKKHSNKIMNETEKTKTNTPLRSLLRVKVTP